MSDAELIARLRKADEYEPLGHDGWEAADRIEALIEQRDAARQDAMDAEDELELQEQEACMMEDGYIKLEKERDALEAKLAKAVKVLEGMCLEFRQYDLPYGSAAYTKARTTLAEIKGESHDCA